MTTRRRSVETRGGACSCSSDDAKVAAVFRTVHPRIALAGLAAGLGLLFAGTAAGEWITNSIALDPGLCGTSLQLGSDRTASRSATPTFMLQGDGGAASYAVSALWKSQAGAISSTDIEIDQ